VKSQSRSWEVARRSRRSGLALLVGAVVLIGLLLVPTPSGAASKQVRFDCPLEKMKFVTLSSGAGAVDVLVGSECVCGKSQTELETGVEIASRDLTLKAVGTRHECPACGEKLRANARFCHGCGEKLDKTPPIKAGYLRCPECDSAVKSKTHNVAGTFCTTCGAKLSGHLDTIWARLADQSPLMRLYGQELPAAGQRSTVRLYCYGKKAIFAYWEDLLAAELGQ
jgi:DNA-directed RNA polymerase subunit RPC12/RpoP